MKSLHLHLIKKSFTFDLRSHFLFASGCTATRKNTQQGRTLNKIPSPGGGARGPGGGAGDTTPAYNIERCSDFGKTLHLHLIRSLPPFNRASTVCTRCCAVLCCAVLCCAVLCCAVLCCGVLFRILRLLASNELGILVSRSVWRFS